MKILLIMLTLSVLTYTVATYYTFKVLNDKINELYNMLLVDDVVINKLWDELNKIKKKGKK